MKMNPIQFNYIKAMKGVFQLFFTTILLLTQLHAFGQGWVRQYPVGDESLAKDMVATPDSGYLLLGDVTDDFADFIAKTDTEGTVEWLQEYDPLYRFYDINVASDGYLATGLYPNYVNPDSASWPLAVKLDLQGNIIWEYDYNPNFPSRGLGLSISATSDGGAIFTGYYEEPIPGGCQDCINTFVVKLDGAGNQTWVYNWTATSTAFAYGRSIQELPSGEFVLAGEYGYSGGNGSGVDPFMVKFSSSGAVVWEKTFSSGHNDYVFDFDRDPSGDFWMVGQRINQPAFDSFLTVIYKVDINGDLIWDTVLDTFQNWSGGSVATLQNGGAVITGTNNSDFPQDTDWYVAKVDDNGNQEWLTLLDWLGTGEARGGTVLENADGTIMGLGTIFNPGNIEKMTLVKMDSLGNVFSRTLSGVVALDQGDSCLIDSMDIPFDQQIIEIVKGGLTLYTSTDSNGYYSMPIDTGLSTVSLISNSPYVQACENPVDVDVQIADNEVAIDFPLQATVDCPYLTVDISTPFLRRCFDNTYTVNYCNWGTEASDDTYIEVTFDPYLTVDSSDVAWTSVQGNTYTFPVDTVPIGACESFNIYTTLVCDTAIFGFTHCVEAHIFPDSFCADADSLWSGASIDVNATCDGDSVYLTIFNAGLGDMDAPLNYIVIEDHLMLMIVPESFQLNSGDSLVITYPANGTAYYLSAQQVPGHPGNNFPAIAIEACGTDSTGNVSLGYVVQFPENDSDPFVSIDCQENIGAWDPNDKRGFPKGYGEEHYIEQNVDLEYHIRFQNTGTDTAFTVRIEDELSEFLDPATIRPGASSHPYQFKLKGEGVLAFLFEDIMLPDSNVNESASHGFVKFRVKQRPDNPIGSMIYNQAAIYFDFNPPIFTNETYHQVGEDFIEMEVVAVHDPTVEADDLKVYPNPFVHQATFEWSGPDLEDALFVIYDISGRAVKQQSVAGNQWNIQREDLPDGLYFFTLWSRGTPLATGKLMVD